MGTADLFGYSTLPEEVEVIEDEKRNQDFLGRDEFINDVKRFILYYSDSRKSVSFSIRGKWGCGKSWIVDKLIDELKVIQSEKTCYEQYAVFKYNAWENDFYEEPLIALLMAIEEQANNKNSIIFRNEDLSTTWDSIWNVSKRFIKNNFNTIVDKLLEASIYSGNPEAIGLAGVAKTANSVLNQIADVKNEIEEEKEKHNDEVRNYDEYFDLKVFMKKALEGLKKLTELQTVVIFIDELDRCLPEYAIKVMERIHHISEGVENIQFIYSIDDEQLCNTVRQIYGPKIQVRDYLAKFMTFGLTVPEVSFTEEVKNEFNDVYGCFNFLYSKKCGKNKIIGTPLGDIPIRVRKQILEKVKLINALIQHNNRDFDYSVLQFELFLAYCDYMIKDISALELQYIPFDTNPNNEFEAKDYYKYELKKDVNVDAENIAKVNDLLLKLIGDVKLSGNMFENEYFDLSKNQTVNYYFLKYLLDFCEHDNAGKFNVASNVVLQTEGINQFWELYKLMEL